MKHNTGILFHEVTMEITAYDKDGRRKYLTRAEGRRFLEQVAYQPRLNALFCLTLYYTGCRISEALNVRVQDIDRELRTILIRSLKKREKRNVRRIPVPEWLMNEIAAIPSPAPNELLWAFSRTTGWRVIKSVMRQANISGIHATTKGLRHGFGVRGAMTQIPVTLIQQWMGHADISTTAIYLDVRDEEERELIERMW
jgi:integrase